MQHYLHAQLNLNIHEQVASVKALTAAKAQLPLSAYDPHINLFIENKFYSQANRFHTQRHTGTDHLQILLGSKQRFILS